MPDKESFLAEACADIPDRRTREKVREELSAHIEDKADGYVICGETEEEAESRAVREMGDAKRLARDLAQVNSFFPLGLFKSAVTLFYVGLIFVSFYIDIGFLDDFFLLCGTCIMFAACFLLRKGNALLCTAWVVSWCQYVHLYTERGQDYFMSPSYRSYLFNWGAGEEYKIFAGRQEQRGYAAFSLVLGDYGSFPCTEQSYRQTSLFRIPFGYDFLEKGIKPSSGWKEYGGQPFKVFPST